MGKVKDIITLWKERALDVIYNSSQTNKYDSDYLGELETQLQKRCNEALVMAEFASEYSFEDVLNVLRDYQIICKLNTEFLFCATIEQLVNYLEIKDENV